MKFLVNIHLKKGVLDPEGKAIHHALENLGFEKVEGVRVGKQILVEVATEDEEEGLKLVSQMADKLLANPVIENYQVEVLK